MKKIVLNKDDIVNLFKNHDYLTLEQKENLSEKVYKYFQNKIKIARKNSTQAKNREVSANKPWNDNLKMIWNYLKYCEKNKVYPVNEKQERTLRLGYERFRFPTMANTIDNLEIKKKHPNTDEIIRLREFTIKRTLLSFAKIYVSNNLYKTKTFQYDANRVCKRLIEVRPLDKSFRRIIRKFS